MSTPVIIDIAIPVPLHQVFSYRVPEHMDVPARGARCLVEFGRRNVVGVVIGTAESTLPIANIKPILTCIDNTPTFDEALLQLCLWASHYYHHPLGDVLHTALPAVLRGNHPIEESMHTHWQLTEPGTLLDPARLNRAPKQQLCWELLNAHPKGLSMPTLTGLGATREALKALEEKGWAQQHQRPLREHFPATLLAQLPKPATAEQHHAITAIRQADGFTPFLLEGITGSGKTEVYLQTMEAVLEHGNQVLVLVPEIGLTPQTIQRFRQRYNVPVISLHSGMTDRERLNGWVQARNGTARIILGTRSAIFTPLLKPGLLVVDECHDLSYKQQDGFRYHARDLAIKRAQMDNIPVILGSATPNLEALHKAHTGGFQHLRLTQRTGDSQPPEITVLDCHDLKDLLHPKSLALLNNTVQAHEQALVFINRRGYAPVILCQDCGWQAQCNHCDATTTWHKSKHQLICHHCGYNEKVPARCPECGSTGLHDSGTGTEKLEELLQQHFPAQHIVRIDRDTTRRKGELNRKLERIHSGEPAILIGTQMLAKGHHFPKLTSIIILGADNGFLSADFRGPEHATQLILQVAGRAGREHHPGRVLIQTRQPELPLLQQLTRGDYAALANTLLEERHMAGLPPFGHLAMVRAESLQPQQALAFLQQLRQQMPTSDDVFLLGPVPAPMEKRAGRYRAQLLLQSVQRRPLHQALDHLTTLLQHTPPATGCRAHIDVDPVDML